MKVWLPASETERTIRNKKPENIIRDTKQGICMLIDTEISGDRNVIKKEAFKIQRPHNRNSSHVEYESKSDTSKNRGDCNHLKSFRQYLSNILGKHEIKELQITSVLEAAHTIRKVLM
jgi:hypothetical protein